MEGIKYVNLIEIGPVVIEICEVENGELVVPVNNTLLRHIAFLAADTRQCILILLVFLRQSYRITLRALQSCHFINNNHINNYKYESIVLYSST